MNYHGDCIEVMRSLPENSVDTCITDPPYELGFMGKKWDSSGVAFQSETWKAVYRVLKPGAILLAFGGTRTYHRMVCAIEDAGFEIRDMVEWVYGSGFPKSLDIGKGIDKQAGAEREVVGMHQNPAGKSQAFVQERSDAAAGCFSGSTKYPDGIPLTKGNSGWDGWGTALKPAHEPIVVAMKPIDGTFVNNALTWGVAGMWVDGGRVETSDKLAGGCMNGSVGASEGWDRPWRHDEEAIKNKVERYKESVQKGETLGRFPANLIHDGSDEVLECFPNDAQRFFYCAKASRSERNAGLEGMPSKQATGGGGLTADTREDGTLETASAGGKYGSIKAYQQNHHPTVKPIELMRYLVRLTKTPTGGVVLDPFMGSGTTGIACSLEGREFIGIEREADYIEIANKRIAYWAMQPGLVDA